MKFNKSCFKLQKKYLAFFTLVPLMVLTALVKVPDPVCSGTGKISNNGMSTVTVLKIDSSLQARAEYDACLSYRVYTYNVIVTLQNSAKERDANGYLAMGIVDSKTGKLLGTQPVLAVVPASQQVQNFFTVTFYLKSDPPGDTRIVAGIDNNDQKCQVCEGTGKVTLNAWMLAKFQKSAYTNVQTVKAQTFEVPEVSLSPEELMGQEWVTDQWILEHPNGTDTSDTPTP